MLAGGKEVNYLMINGEVFGAENNFPCFYKFAKGESSHTYQPNFYHLDYDTKNNPIMSPAGAIAESRPPGDNLVRYLPADLYDMDKATVISIMTFKNEKYALTDCFFGSENGYGGTVWIKMSDFGGGTFLSKMGG